MTINKSTIESLVNNKNEKSLLLILLLFSYFTKIINTDYIFDGTDIPWHVLSGLRLHHTSVLDFTYLGNNFFGQLIQNSHGYSMQFLTWLLYELSFNILKISINETNIIKIHSLFSIFTLIPVYLFFKKNLGIKKSLLLVLIISLLPAHIAYSRSATGPLNISVCFFFLSLYSLDNLIKNYNNKNIFKYSLSVFFYIGSSNIFIIGIIFNFIYILLNEEKINYKIIKNIFVKYYINSISFFLIIFPIIGYMCVTIFSISYGIEQGYILRLISKGQDISFNPFKILKLVEYIGPIFFLSIYCYIRLFKNERLKKINLFFLIYFIIHLFLITISNVDSGYYLFLATPIAYFIIKKITKKNISLVGLFLILNLAYSLSYVYSIPYSFSNENSVSRTIIGAYSSKKNFDRGQKTLAYLIRKNILKVPIIIKKDSFFEEIEIYNIASDIDGMTYYLNKNFIHTNSKKIKIDKDTIIIYAKKNVVLSGIIKKNNLNLLMEICSNNKIILKIYSSAKLNTKKIRCFDTKIYNKKFENSFKTFNDFGQPYLGLF